MNNILEPLLWAKTNPYKELIAHMKESGIVTRILLEDSIFSSSVQEISKALCISQSEAVSMACYLSAMHDIGKCHPLFQSKSVALPINAFLNEYNELNYPFISSDYRHEIGSYSALKRIWKKKKRFSSDVIRQLASIIKIHHQGKTGKDYSLNDSNWQGGLEWINEQEQLEDYFYNLYNPPYIDLDNIEHLDEACMLLSGIVMISDWISSSKMLEKCETVSERDIEANVRLFIELAGIGKVSIPKCDSFSGLWKWIDKSKQRPLQNGIEETLLNYSKLPLITVVEAPMGEGKTEVGIFAACKMAEYWGRNGIYIALPTSATANQMVERFNNLLESHDIQKSRLIHGMSWLHEKELYSESDESFDLGASNWLSSSKKGLLAPFAVGTVDQAMMSALKVKYGIIRLLGLSSKALIIDEIHAYDMYMSTIINRLLEWCKALKIPVVLLSATLPAWKKREMLSIYGKADDLSESHQIITTCYEDGNIRELVINETVQKKSINLEYIDADDIKAAICNAIKQRNIEFGCICVILNTVKMAQEVFQVIKCEFEDFEVRLFHSRFPYGRRQQIETECLDLYGKDKSKRPKKSILVATQVVEQSLDLDFDYMLTEIAPVDLLLQRAGRLHRHNDTERCLSLTDPTISVIKQSVDNFGATEKIYYKLLLERTVDCIRKMHSISIPEDIPDMVDYVYQKETFYEEESDLFIEQMFSEQMKSGLASSIELRKPDKEDFCLSASDVVFRDDESDSWVNAKTRLSEDTARIAIIPASLFSEALQEIDRQGYTSRNLAKRIVPFSVSVSKRQLTTFLHDEEDGNKVIIGKGKLQGMYIYCADNINHNSPYDSLKCTLRSGLISFDRDIGVIFRKGGEMN